ncbi:hypothetical protein ACJBU6_07500 [Exserohilum turcicum]
MTKSVCGVPCSKFQRQVMASDNLTSLGSPQNPPIDACQHMEITASDMAQQGSLINASIVCAPTLQKLPCGRSRGRSSHVCCDGWCGSVRDARPSHPPLVG